MNVCRAADDNSDVVFETNDTWRITPGERSHPARKLNQQLAGFQSLPGGDAMTIVERAVGPVVMLELSGRLVLGEGDEQLKGRVRDLLKQGTTHVMLNMVDVTYVDSSGLGALVGVSLSARHQGGVVTLVTPSKRLMELLTVARLQAVVNVCDSESQALRSLALPA